MSVLAPLVSVGRIPAVSLRLIRTHFRPPIGSPVRPSVRQSVSLSVRVAGCQRSHLPSLVISIRLSPTPTTTTIHVRLCHFDHHPPHPSDQLRVSLPSRTIAVDIQKASASLPSLLDTRPRACRHPRPTRRVSPCRHLIALLRRHARVSAPILSTYQPTPSSSTLNTQRHPHVALAIDLSTSPSVSLPSNG